MRRDAPDAAGRRPCRCPQTLTLSGSFASPAPRNQGRLTADPDNSPRTKEHSHADRCQTHLGFWGGAVAVLAAITGLLGYSIMPEQQSALVETGALIASGIDGLLALWGRISATKRIG